MFGAGINITRYQLSTTPSEPRAATSATGNFRVFLSTTNEAISTFDTSFIPYGNVASYTNVYKGTLSPLSGGKLNIHLSPRHSTTARPQATCC